ncbi:class I SAM-dependent methyltransferase [Streptomyces sp. NPDC048191]|uniref:class I SAM-dependent methyltransferase n=1 Tax=Streptomyces sp. NPDC048191 TaxID=3155484 RepID=UPI00340E23E7
MATIQEKARPPRRLDDVPGWFPVLDQLLFDWFLNRQESARMRGDLLEVGVYMGKSAIFTGRHRQPGEKYTVCDLFEGDAPDDANQAESAKSYGALTRRVFEDNYLSFHEELPRVLQGPSSLVPAEVEPGSCRFVHIDASHLYEHVHGDIGAAHELLMPDGIVVLDDFRSEHTPGVSIATWEAVLNRGLRPVCLSTQKLYGTWGDPEPVQEELLAMVRERSDCHLSVQQAAGHRIVRLKSKGMRAPQFPPSRHAEPAPVPQPAPTPAPAPATAPAPAPTVRPAPRRGPSRARRVAVDLLPPVVTRAIRRARTARHRPSQPMP